jgi:hypothetical protein
MIKYLFFRQIENHVLFILHPFQPNHFIPRFTTLNWGICLPSSCTYEDAGTILEHFVKPYNSTGVKIFIEIEESNCYVKKYQTWSDVLKDNWSLVAAL